MIKNADLKFVDNQIELSGELDFYNVRSVFNESLNYLSNHHKIVIDFENVTFSNSAALALIIEWLKYAKTKRKKISFTHLPEHLLELVKATDTSALIFENQ